MNIKLEIRKTASRLLKLIPSSFHGALLKQYAMDRGVSVKSGYVVVKQDWSSPVVVAEEINPSILGARRDLPGIRIDQQAIEELGAQLSSHTAEFPWRDQNTDQPEVPWGYMFPTLDSMALYAMIRKYKPKRYVEVGCGYSSRVSSAAASLNTREGSTTSVTYIEPYPGNRLEKDNLSGELIEKKIQDVPLDLFSSLEPGDMVFIDTSHVLKCQSDVEWELLHILPVLKAGVIVHIHDLYTPYEQPSDWLDNNYAPGYYNEQYAVEALLSGGGRFKTIFPLHYLCREKDEFIRKWFDHAPDSSRSYWIMAE